MTAVIPPPLHESDFSRNQRWAAVGAYQEQQRGAVLRVNVISNNIYQLRVPEVRLFTTDHVPTQ